MAYFAPAITLRDRDGDCRLVDIKPDECAILHVVSPPFLRLGASLSGATLERRMPRERPPNQSAHTAIMGSKGMSEQLGPYGVTVNCVQPGLIDTAQIRRLYPGDEHAKFASREIALRDFGEPQDVANSVTFLASPCSRYISGIVLLVDGGMRRYSFLRTAMRKFATEVAG